jgi:hypothetical protein
LHSQKRGLESPDILEFGIVRIYLPSPIKDNDVEKAVSLLRGAGFSVGSGAVIRQADQPTYGAISVYGDAQTKLALKVLAQAGIKAIAE